MVKKTFDELNDYNNAVAYFTQRNPKNEDTKLGYAISRFAKKFPKLMKSYSKLLQKFEIMRSDERIRLASTKLVDGVKIINYQILKDARGNETREFQFEPEKLIALNKKINEINEQAEIEIEEIMKTTVEFEPYYATELPEGLTALEKQVFVDIVIDPKMLDEYEKNAQKGATG